MVIQLTAFSDYLLWFHQQSHSLAPSTDCPYYNIIRLSSSSCSTLWFLWNCNSAQKRDINESNLPSNPYIWPSGTLNLRARLSLDRSVPRVPSWTVVHVLEFCSVPRVHFWTTFWLGSVLHIADTFPPLADSRLVSFSSSPFFSSAVGRHDTK